VCDTQRLASRLELENIGGSLGWGNGYIEHDDNGNPNAYTVASENLHRRKYAPAQDEVRATAPLAILEEVRARLGDDDKLLSALKVERNTLNLWRKRKQIPGDKLQKLNELADQVAANDERRQGQAVKMLLQVVDFMASTPTASAAQDRGESDARRDQSRDIGPTPAKAHQRG
jgi:hypothetical protein